MVMNRRRRRHVTDRTFRPVPPPFHRTFSNIPRHPLRVILVPDLIMHFAGWDWWAHLASDAVKAAILALIASQLSRLREERLLRRQRELGYLNHHIRNSLAVIQVAEHQLPNTALACEVRLAIRRICTVLEQLTRDEEVFIDRNTPAKFKKAG
jgi:hypothetical protein